MKFVTSSSWLGTLTLGIIFGIQIFHIILLIKTLFEIANSFQLDLVFLHPFSSEFNNYHIYSDWRLTSDHTPISVDILIFDEHISTKKQSLIKNSDEKNHFLEELINFIKSMDMSSIHNIEVLENIV